MPSNVLFGLAAVACLVTAAPLASACGAYGPTNNLQDEIFRCNINATHENIENIDTENIDNIENNINATGIQDSSTTRCSRG